MYSSRTHIKETLNIFMTLFNTYIYIIIPSVFIINDVQCFYYARVYGIFADEYIYRTIFI